MQSMLARGDLPVAQQADEVTKSMNHFQRIVLPSDLCNLRSFNTH
jgi:hypothetical protein